MVMLLIFSMIVVIIIIARQMIKVFWSNLPLWWKTQSLELLLKVFQFRIKLILFPVEIGHYVINLTVAIFSVCVLLSWLISLRLSYAFLITIWSWVEGFVSSMICADWHPMICNLILMFSPSHLSWNKIVTLYCSLVTRSLCTEMSFLISLRKWRFRVAWWLLIMFWSTSAICVLNVLLVCHPARHSFFLISMFWTVPIVSRRTSFSQFLMDLGWKLIFVIISGRYTIINIVLPIFLYIPLILTSWAGITCRAVLNLFIAPIVLRFLVSLTTIFKWRFKWNFWTIC